MGTRPPKSGEIIKKIQNTLLIDGNALFKTGFFVLFILILGLIFFKYV